MSIDDLLTIDVLIMAGAIFVSGLVRGFTGGEVKVHRHRRASGEQGAEVGEGDFGAVLREDGYAPPGAEIHSEQAVGHAVEDLVDLGPGQLTSLVDEGETGRVGRGGCSSEGGHRGRN